MDSIPLAIVTDQVTHAAINIDIFQETDIFGITLPIIKTLSKSKLHQITAIKNQ